MLRIQSRNWRPTSQRGFPFATVQLEEGLLQCKLRNDRVSPSVKSHPRKLQVLNHGIELYFVEPQQLRYGFEGPWDPGLSLFRINLYCMK